MRSRFFVAVIAVAICGAMAGGVAGCAGALRGSPDPPKRQSRVKLRAAGFVVGNGLRVVAITEPEATDVAVTVRYDVGAKDEPAGQEGIAHLAEHLMFEQIHDGRDIASRLDAASTWHNAYTDVDATVYVSRGRPDQLAALLEVEGIRLGLRCQSITDAAFVRAREVVLNELRQRGDYDLIRLRLYEAMFPAGHPYRRTPAGTQATVGAVTRDQACAFIDAHYAPGNAVLVVSGPIDEAAVDAALGQMFGRISKREFTPGRAVQPATGRGAVAITAPVDEDLAVLAWPLPTDAGERAKVRAVATMVQDRINFHIKGSVMTLVLGAPGAEVLAMLMVPADGESVPAMVSAAKDGVDGTPQWMAQETFERSRQAAAYRAFAALEERDRRDLRIAAEMMTPGTRPGDTIGDELAAVNKLSRDEAREVARTWLSWGKALAITVKADDSGGGHGTLAAAAAIPAAERRMPTDGTGADKPAVFDGGTSPLAKAITRRLGNGMDVILMPLSSVPTVEVRLVFPVGTAADPKGRSGAAAMAAYGIAHHPRDFDALIAFYTVGGLLDMEVSRDSTTFVATGLDMYIDHTLTVIERLVRNGGYPSGSIEAAVDRAHKAEAEDQDDKAVIDDLTAAMFGAGHPYAARSGVVGDIGVDALGEFQRRHYKPGGATLIVSGGFDPAIATKWIDHLFADWSGTAREHATPPAKQTPKVIVKDVADVAQLDVMLVFGPATAAAQAQADRAAYLIATEMLDQTAGSVRDELAATYGVHAALLERRAATRITLEGKIDRRRATEALALLAARLAELRAGGAAIAPRFVAARRRVLEQLSNLDTGAHALASHVDGVLDRGATLADDLAGVEQAKAVTLDDVLPILATIDPSLAVIRLEGPEEEMSAAVKALTQPAPAKPTVTEPTW
jgi:zinc protease